MERYISRKQFPKDKGGMGAVSQNGQVKCHGGCYCAGIGQSVIKILGLFLFALGYLSVECLFLCYLFGVFLLAQRDKFAGPLALSASLYGGLLIVIGNSYKALNSCGSYDLLCDILFGLSAFLSMQYFSN